MDCNMPIKDGYETTTEIRQFLYEKQIDQPLICALTGQYSKIFTEKAINSGMNLVIPKPAPPEQMNQIIKQLGIPSTNFNQPT